MLELGQDRDERSHVIRIADDVFEMMLEQANPSALITVRWGEPDAQGVYEPTITITHLSARVVFE